MSRVATLLLAITLSIACSAQHIIPLRTIWTRPQVHVIFQGYAVSFTIKDIDRALQLLTAAGDTTFGNTSGLDTSGNYFMELFPGLRTEYKTRLQAVMQKGVGAFLLTAGHAYIENARHKKVKAIITDMQPRMNGTDITTVKCYDPVTNMLLFEGMMATGLYNQDLGID